MNIHIKLGNDALRVGDTQTAVSEFLLALDDENVLVQRIARNRLFELHPEQVYGSTHSYQQLYHRPNCPAKNVTWKNHLIWFKDWRRAEEAGYHPCKNCKPLRGSVYISSTENDIHWRRTG